MTHNPRVAIFGAGAVGCYLGAKLGQGPSRPPVTLVGRPAVRDAVLERGLVLAESDRESITHPNFHAEVEAGGDFDLVLLTVKTPDVEHSIPSLRRLLAPSGLLVAFQNGVGSEERLIEAFGADRVLAGALTVKVEMREPGVVSAAGAGGIALAGAGSRPAPEWVLSLFRARFPVILVDGYQSLRWSKLLLNSIGAASSAILDIDLDVLVSDPALFRIEQLAFREATRVMRVQRIPIVDLPGYRVRAAATVMRLPRPLAQRILAPRMAVARAGRSPGMRADLDRGRTEIGEFNGAVAAAGAGLGVPTPVNAALTALVKKLSANPPKREWYEGKPEALIAYLAAREVNVL
ncbi:MAG: ketopantoate reductase family protein [Chloroflexota bacterium]